MKPQGALVVKVFHGSGYSQLVKLFKESFQVVKPIKPKASRDKSSETFLVGMGLKSRPQLDKAVQSRQIAQIPRSIPRLNSRVDCGCIALKRLKSVTITLWVSLLPQDWSLA